jgi:hypothetical protein
VGIKIRSNEPKLNQQNGKLVRGDLRDLSKGIHNVNRFPRPNPLNNAHIVIILDIRLINVHLLKIM